MPAEAEQRKIAVLVVVAVQEPPLLLTVEWDVAGVEVEDNLLRLGILALQEDLDPKPF